MTEQVRILIVDDEQTVRRLLKERLSVEGYHCREAASAAQALEELRNDAISLVLLDINMPGKSGVELLPELRASFPDTAVVMATAISDAGIAVRCMKNGAYDYVTKPFSLDDVLLSVERALERRRLELEVRDYRQHLEQMVEQRTEELRQAISKIKLSSLDTIHRLSHAAEYKDQDTGTHIKRIGRCSACLASRLGLSDAEVESILYAAPMHDVGKIGVPDHILLKPGKLDPDEWSVMKQHTTIGAQILQGSDAEFIKMAEVIALTHHEKWDGTGYPRGLKGTEIPLPGRIVAIVDVFDALVMERPYKKPFSPEESLGVIREERGRHFDPEVVDALLAIENEISGIREEYKD